MRRWLIAFGAVVSIITIALIGSSIADRPEPLPVSPENSSASRSQERVPNISHGEKLPVAPTTILKFDQDRALATALESEEVKQRIEGKRVRTVSIQEDRVLVRQAPKEEMCRKVSCLQVTIFNYTDNKAVFVRVDKSAWRVLQVSESSSQPTLSPVELQIAHQKADADPEVAIQTGGTGHEHLGEPHHAGQRSGPCSIYRCAAVFYKGEASGKLVVIVNLNDETVVGRINRP